MIRMEDFTSPKFPTPCTRSLSRTEPMCRKQVPARGSMIQCMLRTHASFLCQGRLYNSCTFCNSLHLGAGEHLTDSKNCPRKCKAMLNFRLSTRSNSHKLPSFRRGKQDSSLMWTNRGFFCFSVILPEWPEIRYNEHGAPLGPQFNFRAFA